MKWIKEKGKGKINRILIVQQEAKIHRPAPLFVDKFGGLDCLEEGTGYRRGWVAKGSSDTMARGKETTCRCSSSASLVGINGKMR